MERSTQQKTIIDLLFKTINRPLTIKEIHHLASERYPAINLATVYRNINKLLKQGVIREIFFERNLSAFELITEGHHHYCICTTCGKIFRFTGCCDFSTFNLPNFSAHTHSLTIYGICETCSSTELVV